MKFAIGIPTLNRFDILLPSLMIYANDFKGVDIYVLDNGKQNISKDPIIIGKKNIHITEVEQNLGVGASWNFLINKIFENHDNALILNDDILLGKNKTDIEELIKKNKSEGLLKCTLDWCAFIMTKKTWKEVGDFDTIFYPAYYEDKSYEYRMKLNGYLPIRSVGLNPFIYQSSKTLEKMPSLQESSIKNKTIYIKMWGGEPHQEKYKTPFNK